MAGKGTTVRLNEADLEFLERTGARPHRGGDVFSRARSLRRALAACSATCQTRAKATPSLTTW
jgi:hypothetical protein